MNRYYRTGQIAKMANVSERTIRYYDKIGLLKPSFVQENGYRQYNDNDFIKLQKILSLRYLGFSIEEIFSMISDDETVEESLDTQIELMENQISKMQNVLHSLRTVKQTLNHGQVDWDHFTQLVQLMSRDSDIVKQYKNSKNLKIRIDLHEKFSVSRQSWFEWIQAQIDYTHIQRLIEIGCGNGQLWKHTPVNLRNREIFITDKSQGMVDEVRHALGKDFNCLVADCQSIPFRDGYFDAVVCNHVLFYVRDIHKGIREMARVLRDGGYVYASTYGKNHMKEITALAQAFDARVRLSDTTLYDVFGLENGKDLLQPYFKRVTLRLFDDQLVIDQAGPLVDYIMSCHGNQNEIIGPRIQAFKRFVEKEIREKGPIKVTKEAGLFVCRK